MGKREKMLAWAAGADVVLVLGVFHKKTQKTPPRWIEICRKRLRLFDES